jgi:hypothetical protein
MIRRWQFSYGELSVQHGTKAILAKLGRDDMALRQEDDKTVTVRFDGHGSAEVSGFQSCNMPTNAMFDSL